MTREDKQAVIDALKTKLSSTTSFYVTDASGMTVAQTNNFRRLCHEKGLEYVVVKNTLIEKALESQKGDYTTFTKEVLRGFSGIIFAGEVANLPAKMLIEFRGANAALGNKPLLKGASIDTAVFIGDDQLDTLSKLKSKEELVGEIIGLLQSPAKNVISGLKASGGKLAGILKTLSEKEEQAQ